MNERPTILLVDVGTVLGGAEVHAERLTCLMKDDASFLVLCFHPEMHARLRIRGIRSFCPALPRARWIRRPGKYLLAMILVPWLILRYRIRIVHLNGYQASYLACITRLLKRRTIITPHHLPPERRTRSWYRRTAWWADCAINVSETAASDHRALLPKVRSVTIRNWIQEPPRQLAARLGFGVASSYLAELYLLGGLTATAMESVIIGCCLDMLHRISAKAAGTVVLVIVLPKAIYLPRLALLAPLAYLIRGAAGVVVVAVLVLLLDAALRIFRPVAWPAVERTKLPLTD